jgi:hypothetical protein
MRRLSPGGHRMPLISRLRDFHHEKDATDAAPFVYLDKDDQ